MSFGIMPCKFFLFVKVVTDYNINENDSQLFVIYLRAGVAVILENVAASTFPTSLTVIHKSCRLLHNVCKILAMHEVV